MSQLPLAPPTPTGQPIDGWLYLLWKRLTATGQLLWSSIVPGTSADVAAVVTDETGSPGSLVFSGNPTLDGCYINGIFYQGSTTSIVGQTLLSGVFSTDTAAGTVLGIRKSCTAINGPNFVFAKSRGTASSPSTIVADDAIGSVSYSGFDGTNYTQSIQIIGYADGAISSGVVPGRLLINTLNSSGTFVEAFMITSTQVVTLGGSSTAPALKVIPVASQAQWVEVTGATSGGNPTIGTSAGSLNISTGILLPIATNTAATLTVTDAHSTIIQTTAASVYTLPTASSYTGRCYRIVTQFAGTVTSASSNVVPLAGGAAGTAILAATAGKWADIQSDGTNWIIVASN